MPGLYRVSREDMTRLHVAEMIQAPSDAAASMKRREFYAPSNHHTWPCRAYARRRFTGQCCTRE